jgi:hypothetical protein
LGTDLLSEDAEPTPFASFSGIQLNLMDAMFFPEEEAQKVVSACQYRYRFCRVETRPGIGPSG